MAEDLINNKDIYFPSNLGTNDKLISLLNRASRTLCDWFSKADKNGPLPFDESFNCIMPAEDGNSEEDLFSDIESLLNNSFNPVHPGSLAHLDPPPLIFSILGDLIAAGLNNNLLAYELSPSVTLLEESLCNWFAKKIGFNDFSGGIAASGGTLSNLNALIAARYNAGLGSDPNSVLLVSEDAHSSFVKCIRVMGLDTRNLVRIKTDNQGRMDINDLRNSLDKCSIENKKIFAIVATLGTTVRGAIDPIKEISEICKQRNIWLHIDGSIGGIFAITSIPIEGLNNINQANSITINPQKIIGITKTSSLLLVSNLSTLKNTFNTGLPYISSKENIINRGEIGIQGSRPAEVIKLWLGLRFLGLKGIEIILKSSIKRKEFFVKNISKYKFDIYSGPLHIVSFLPSKLEPRDSDAWTKTKVNELIKNNFMLSRPKFKGKYFLRVVMGNYNTKDSDIEELLRLLDA
ncbi:aminotransferase class V-fold PLP-dependent enzyme [Prochlorococcus marinus XMU1414]|uniref:Aminotransferase class V-fold PLP-dependent enzyme n=1 Tax=Prochlorococcus marinus XMU1424 TaxID=2774497 RepID=A0A9D9G6R6_PROMR|nr:aminotransferase class V-fold PLP-dependent enzyme [Prochlorococcus marinus]MBO8228185.1 aminotransferase class V-fold PLP-dependent enzyme [Prochlorococcus marinus XMU1414]MBW3045687.1 aspartate aminotransferase family protein [Prochlorococcus marinus str. MU1414]MCR8532035.1 aminotransferase class V-fold PLP-dependent enzyme [Prochlorococcus marinus XMU1420]MCR8535562.1 aminotransferase class V-fold PLP-dependent enzyme [Prochlorococcus marinus XMU1424]